MKTFNQGERLADVGEFANAKRVAREKTARRYRGGKTANSDVLYRSITGDQ